jgi:hypothetical protein
MKKFFSVVFLALALTAWAPGAQAREGTGLGIEVGSPNGITARHWFTETTSLDGAAGWSLSDSRFQVSSDFLWTLPDAILLGSDTFDFFYGAGLSLRTKSGSDNNDVVFGPRIPVGVGYQFVDPNLEVFVQAALNMGLIPSSDLYLDANLGVRFYF